MKRRGQRAGPEGSPGRLGGRGFPGAANLGLRRKRGLDDKSQVQADRQNVSSAPWPGLCVRKQRYFLIKRPSPEPRECSFMQRKTASGFTVQVLQ